MSEGTEREPEKGYVEGLSPRSKKAKVKNRLLSIASQHLS
jgi:hypothetical protein